VATLRGLAVPPGKFPFGRTIEPSPTERFRADALWAVAQCICTGKAIDPALVTSRQEIGDFLRHAASERGVEESHILQGWRREALGQPLLDLMTREGAVQLRWTDGALRSV